MDEPRKPEEWDLPVKWVVVTGVVVWLLAAGFLVAYLLGSRSQP